MKLIELLEQRNIYFKKIDKKLVVFGGYVDLSNTQLKKFPNCPITFSGSLNSHNTPIKELPDYPMMFCGSLFLNKTKIKELPDRITCYDLNINHTSITKIPKNVIADRIFIPVINGKVTVYIKKNGIIGIDYNEKSIEGWEKFFKKEESIIYDSDLLSDSQYHNLIEQDFYNAVKLYKSWNS